MTHTFLPELLWVADGVWVTQLRVQVVVDPSHLSHPYPVLPLEWKSEGPPAQVRWHIENESSHIRQLYTAHIPGEEESIQTI